MKRGKVIGIDISPTVIRVAKARGLKNCKVANIFTWKPRQKFDTIALIENNLGIAETPEKTKEDSIRPFHVRRNGRQDKS